jgi:hypothetical protein
MAAAFSSLVCSGGSSSAAAVPTAGDAGDKIFLRLSMLPDGDAEVALASGTGAVAGPARGGDATGGASSSRSSAATHATSRNASLRAKMKSAGDSPARVRGSMYMANNPSISRPTHPFSGLPLLHM